MSIKYRPDIDGLRAVAVLSVIVSHINPGLLPGGFLGVDVFFVISGYLITSLLLSEAEATGTVSILDFYKRRVKRIVPALMFTLVGTLVVGYALMLPDDFRKLLASSVWSVLSTANVYFYAFLDTGYFAPSSAEIPLLHLWSLGVEEQFYILWPFIVLAGVRVNASHWGKGAVLCIGMALSLAASEFFRARDFSLVYYMIPFRSWEPRMMGRNR